MVATPGVKPNLGGAVYEVADQTMISVMGNAKSRPGKITFSDNVEKIDVTPYAEQYGSHPRTFEIYADVRNKLHRRTVSPSRDPFTGQHRSEMNRRRGARNVDSEARTRILEKVLLDGAAWEVTPASLITAVSKKNKFKVKRVGAKAVKAAELLAKGSVH